MNCIGHRKLKTRVRGLAAMSLMGALLVLGASPVLAAPQLNDSAITDAVEDEILLDTAVSLNNISVSTQEGVVTLVGTTGNLLAKERAVDIAQTVKGARSVVNNITVTAEPGLNDATLADRVNEALLYDPAADSFEIAVNVEDGKATLSGTVGSWQEKELALKVAKGVNGITDIEDAISIEYEADRPDAEIMLDIEQALRWDTLVDDALIETTVDDGNVHLSGTVGSAAEKNRAVFNAWVAGVNNVDADSLQVKRWARDEDLRKDKYTGATDSEIQQAVNDAMLYDPRVYSFNISAQVDSGVATLRGTVDNLKAKRAAEANARNTVGVLRVKNRLKVRPAEEAAEDAIAQNVRDALQRDPYVEQFEIAVSVDDGKAYLSGMVDSYFEKGQADDIASRAAGVTEVVNNLVVDSDYDPYAYDPYIDHWYVYGYPWYDYDPGYVIETDGEIKDDIESQLWWSPFVDSNEVTVTVDDGVATLTGTVDTWSEYWSARENALEGGATWVDNDLNVAQ